MSAFGIFLILMALLGLWEIVTGLLMMLMGLAIILCAYWRWTVAIAVVLTAAVGTAWIIGERDQSGEVNFADEPYPRRSR